MVHRPCRTRLRHTRCPPYSSTGIALCINESWSPLSVVIWYAAVLEYEIYMNCYITMKNIIMPPLKRSQSPGRMRTLMPWWWKTSIQQPIPLPCPLNLMSLLRLPPVAHCFERTTNYESPPQLLVPLLLLLSSIQAKWYLLQSLWALLLLLLLYNIHSNHITIRASIRKKS